jgi:hypothetical protein
MHRAPGPLMVALFLSSVFASAASAETSPVPDDVVILRNGDRISGHLIEADNQLLRVSSRSLGELRIHWTDISEVQGRRRDWRVYDGSLSSPVVFENAVLRLAESGATLDAGDRGTQVPLHGAIRAAVQEHPAAGLTQLMNAKSPVPPPDTSFAVSLNAPQSIVLGSQSQIVFGGNLRVLHNEPDLCAPPSWFSALLASANHNKSYKPKMPAVVTDTFDGTVSLANGLSSKSTIAGYVIADEYGNSSLGIGLQQSYGAGIKGTIYSNSCHGTKTVQHYRLAFTGDASLRYIHQRLYAPGGSNDLAGLKLGGGFVFAPFKRGDGQNEWFVLDQSIWVVPMLNDNRAVQAGGSFVFSVPVTKSLSLGLTEEDDFLNNAPKAKRKNYLKSALSVTYTFPPTPK